MCLKYIGNRLRLQANCINTNAFSLGPKEDNYIVCSIWNGTLPALLLSFG